eukprot:1159459-Pelagomonas_calceolata.AAC.9
MNGSTDLNRSDMWEATCLGAPSDAVEPAVLLSIQEQRRVLGSSKPAQVRVESRHKAMPQAAAFLLLPGHDIKRM